MEKKAQLTAAFISALLISAVAGTQFVNLGRANPYSQAAYSGEMTPPRNATPPIVRILRPANNKTYNTNFGILSLWVTIGQAPYSQPRTHKQPGILFRNMFLSEVYYETDWQENKTVLNGTNTLTFYFNYNGTSRSHWPTTPSTYKCELKLEGIPEGTHTIKVNATERGYYYAGYRTIYGFSLSAFSSVNFTIDTTPVVSFSSFENRTFVTSDVPLNFTVNQSVSQITYYLDGLENVTISGNTTLTGLANGDHNVTVYATDEAGNTGASETITFTIAKPELQPETFPTKFVAAASGASVAAVGAGLLVYFKKRRH